MSRPLDPAALRKLLAVTKVREGAARSAVQALVAQEAEIVRRISELAVVSECGDDVQFRSDLWRQWVLRRQNELELERSRLRARRAPLDKHLATATAKRAALESIYENARIAARKRREERDHMKLLEQEILRGSS